MRPEAEPGLLQGCSTQMNIWEDRASEWVCSVCNHFERNTPVVLACNASGAVGQFTARNRRDRYEGHRRPTCGPPPAVLAALIAQWLGEAW